MNLDTCRHARPLAALAVLAIMVSASTPAAPWASSDPAKVRLLWNLRIPMRDGVTLSADAYLPSDADSQGNAAHPSYCVLSRTPYTADSLHERAVFFASHGVTFVSQDVRGRGNSDGVFDPFLQERMDGYDSVEWLAKQPWCHEHVAMWGGSYGGWTQWAAAGAVPPHLLAIVPVASPAAGADMPGIGMIGTTYILPWLVLTSGHALQAHLYADPAWWSERFRSWTEAGTSFRTLDERVGLPSALFESWTTHPDQDEYWQRYNPAAADYSRMRMPVLTITGMYDDAQRGSIAHYRAQLAANPAARHWLIIGPWDHGGTRDPQLEFGGVRFAEASRVDLNQLHLDFYAYAANAAEVPLFLRERVTYYVAGAERWRYAASLGAVTAEQRPFYLDSHGQMGTDFGSGMDHYVWDPHDTRGSAAEAAVDPSLLVNLATPHSVLIYQTRPFDGDIELSGFFHLTAWLALDQPDTDFYLSARLMQNDGSTLLLANSLARARYRNGWARPQLVATNTAIRYDFSDFTFMSRLIRKGERIQLIVGPSSSNLVEKNYNTGGVIANTSMAEARTVTVKLLHDRAHPSALYLPIASTPHDL